MFAVQSDVRGRERYDQSDDVHVRVCEWNDGECDAERRNAQRNDRFRVCVRHPGLSVLHGGARRVWLHVHVQRHVDGSGAELRWQRERELHLANLLWGRHGRGDRSDSLRDNRGAGGCYRDAGESPQPPRSTFTISRRAMCPTQEEAALRFRVRLSSR
jgi:hypothetical protein